MIIQFKNMNSSDIPDEIPLTQLTQSFTTHNLPSAQHLATFHRNSPPPTTLNRGSVARQRRIELLQNWIFIYLPEENCVE